MSVYALRKDGDKWHGMCIKDFNKKPLILKAKEATNIESDPFTFISNVKEIDAIYKSCIYICKIGEKNICATFSKAKPSFKKEAIKEFENGSYSNDFVYRHIIDGGTISKYISFIVYYRYKDLNGVVLTKRILVSNNGYIDNKIFGINSIRLLPGEKLTYQTLSDFLIKNLNINPKDFDIKEVKFFG